MPEHHDSWEFKKRRLETCSARYVVVEILSTQESKKDVSSSAVFYERFTFDIPSKSSSKACFVVIDIKEKGLFRSHSIGKCTIGSISPFEGDAQKPKWFTITDRKNADTGAQLKVCAQYVFLPDHKRSRGNRLGEWLENP